MAKKVRVLQTVLDRKGKQSVVEIPGCFNERGERLIVEKGIELNPGEVVTIEGRAYTIVGTPKECWGKKDFQVEPR